MIDPNKPIANVPENAYSDSLPMQHLGHLLHHVASTTEAELANRTLVHGTLDRACLLLAAQSLHLAISIRENNRHGLLQASLTIARPLWEKVTTARYLQKHPDKVQDWYSNWRQRKPSFATLAIEAGFLPENQPPEMSGYLHSFVHADQSTWNITVDGLGGTNGRFSSGPMTKSSDLCDFTCLLACRALVAIDACSFDLVSPDVVKDQPRYAAAYFYKHFVKNMRPDE